ncbi:MAG: hypothetical protein OXQ86_07715 [Gammaproteobacteria bacterium]|nr:hypothetical protein [Gammaproteobacteria bacterium]MDE0414460.1 hypothetical protein [Gammaproteobacteria bacterium]
MFRGMQEVVVSVWNMERLRSTLMDIGRWSAHPLPDAPPEQFAAWQMPGGCTRIEQSLLMPEDDERGFIRLVRFHGLEAEPMRPSQHTWDSGGIFDINVYVKDAQATYDALQRVGWTALGPPTDYHLADFSIRQAVTVGPDGVVIVLLQAYGKVLIELPHYTGMSRTFNALQIVRDYDVSFDFFVNGLGWKPLVETVVEGAEEPGRNMLGIPANIARGLRRRVSILHPEGTNDGSVQILEIRGLEGSDFASRCLAPNVGYLCARFPVADAAAYADELRGRDVVLYTEPSKLFVAPYGAVTLFSVRTPDGAILEFYTTSDSA